MRSVTFENTSETPVTLTRTLSIVVNDGEADAVAVSRDIEVQVTNNSPTLSGIESAALQYTQNDPATLISNTLTLADADDTDLEGATVEVAANYAAGEDVLAFADQNGISGTFDSVAGTLTLTGTSSIANYETALRSVTFENTNVSPSTGPRTISFSVNDGDIDSNLISREIHINAPQLGNAEVTALDFTENDPAVAITTGMTVTDVDDVSLESATVEISSGYQDGEDVLSFSDQNGITGSFDSVLGTMFLTGSASLADYQAAIRSVTYQNASDAPTTGSRTVRFQVHDGDAPSLALTRDLNIADVNDPPQLADIETGELDYAEGVGPTAVSATLRVIDPDSNIESAQVAITPFQNGEDVLTFVDQNGITGTFDAIAGTLSLSGSASPADYEAALRSVAYENTSQTPIELDRTVTISVNDGVVDSNEVSRTLSVTSVNDAPELDNIEVSDLAYTENSGMVAVTSALTITDADDTHADSAAVQITANYSTGEDLLSFVNQNGIVGNFDAATGTLALTGTATLGNYQTALRSVTYQNASDSPSELVRTFTINVDDGLNQSLGVTRNLLVSGENDLPSLTSLETSPLVYAENDDAVTISATISAADLDDDNFESASIAIANYQNGEDLLQFVDQNGIVGTFDAVSGVLTLSGSAAKSDYEIALRSVAYVNQSDSPSELTRTLSFAVNDGDGDSVAVQRDLMVTGSNDSPTLASIEETPLRYQTGDGAVAVSSSLNTDDLDDSDLEGATVQVTSGYQNGEDVLSFSDQNGITGSFDALSGTLSLSGTASVADYEAALHTVAYENTSGTPVAAPRVISFVVNDGDADSDVLAREVAINPPTVSSFEVTPLAVSENDAPTNVTATLVLADVDDTDLQGATVSISSNYESGADLLTFVDQSGITGTFDEIEGRLTLSGAASVSDYESALRSVTYETTSDTPSELTRTLSVHVSDLHSESNVQTRDIALTAENDLPVIDDLEADALIFATGVGAAVVSSSITVADPDGDLLVGATVQISGNYESGEDVLAFQDQLGISGSFDAVTGTLALTGTASAADYQTAFRSITYSNANDPVVESVRTVSFTANDGTGDSATASREIDVRVTNTAPLLDAIETTLLTFVENDLATAITASVTVSDSDDVNIESATVSVTSNFVTGQDELGFVDQSGILGDYDATTGVLTLDGVATIAEYEAALRSVTYRNLSNNPDLATRTVSFSVDDGGNGSNVVTRDIAITAENDKPIVAFLETDAASYGGLPVSLSDTLEVFDSDDTDLESAIVSISSNHAPAEDLLNFVDQNNIVGSYDTNTGELSLVGTASVADYREALRSVQYRNAGPNPDTAQRTLTITVSDGDEDSSSVARDLVLASTIDFGDARDFDAGTAPGEYRTRVDDDGPSHIVDADLSIGSLVDGEFAARASSDMLGDDTDNVDDEDGLDGVLIRVGETPALDIPVTNSTGAEATLLGWIDYNGDGLFDDESEAASVVVSDGTVASPVTLVFPQVPVTAVTESVIRLRLTTDGSVNSATGPATDGEVEDHEVLIVRPLVMGLEGRNWWVTSHGEGTTITEHWSQFPFEYYEVVRQGDFNGDGLGDVATHRQGAWTVGLSDGAQFSHDVWEVGDPEARPEDVFAGDFNGDGLTDLAARQAGAWRISLSDGTQFLSSTWTGLSGHVTWDNLLVADVNDDGRSDIVGRIGREWWVSLSNGAGFVNEFWGVWDATVPWDDVQPIDANGDGMSDLVGRNPATGNWHVVVSDGSSFDGQIWGGLSASAAWQDVLVADANGDGYEDLVARTASGEWWASLSDGSQFANTYLGRWSNANRWLDTSAIDIDGDGDDDIVARNAATGRWRFGSIDSSGTPTLTDEDTITWSVSANWSNVATVSPRPDNRQGTNPYPSIVGIADGEIWVTKTDGSQFHHALWSDVQDWPWQDVQRADFNDDGQLDIAGRATDGTWYVGVASGDSFVISLWGSWSENVTWSDVQNADINGDGKADIIGHTDGEWWVATSSGSSFSTTLFGQWSAATDWQDVYAADVNGDGRADVVGRTGTEWWAVESSEAGHTTRFWGRWSESDWDEVFVADLNYDGHDDVIGRDVTTGQWQVGISDGNSFVREVWGGLSVAATWTDFVVGDFNADHLPDIAARAGGDWWASMSTGETFRNQFLGRWSESVQWQAVTAFDIDGDGDSDLLGRNDATGEWTVGITDDGRETVQTRLLGQWDNNVTWETFVG